MIQDIGADTAFDEPAPAPLSVKFTVLHQHSFQGI